MQLQQGVSIIYTMFQKSKLFDNNFGKCGPIFFHQAIRKKILYVHNSMLLHYLVKVENPKMLPNFHVQRDI